MSDSTAPPRRARLLLLAACVGTMSLSDLSIWLRPAVTFAVGPAKGLSDDVAGTAITAELLCLSITMLFCSRFARSIRFRSLALIGFALAVSMSVATIGAQAMVPIVLARGAAGVGFGILAVVAYAVAARLPDPQRAFGYLFTVTNVVSFAAMALLLPALEAQFVNAFPLVTYIVMAAIMLPLILLIPGQDGFDGKAAHDGALHPEPRVPWRRIAMLAAAIAVHSVAYQGIWAFLYLLGGNAGVSAESLGMLMALTTLASIAGSLGSAWFSRVLGRSVFVYVALALASLCLLALLAPTSPIAFSIAAIGAIFFLFTLYPAIFGIAAEIDPSGRGAGFVQGAAMLFGAAGPIIAGHLFDRGMQLAVLAGSALTFAIALTILAFVLRAMRESERSEREKQSTV